MTNDTSTLSGALLEMKDQLIYELGQKGVTASYDSTTGLLGLIGRIADIQQGGGSCYHIEFSESSYTAVGGSATLEVYLQSNYAPLANATVTVTGSDSSLYTGITDSTGLATVTVTNISSETIFTCTYQNVSDTATVTVQQGYLFYDDASTDRSSEYTKMDNKCTFTYNSGGYYVLTKSSSSGTSGVKVNSASLPKNVKITVDIQMKSSGNLQPKLVFMDTTQTYGYVSRLTYVNAKGSIIEGSFTAEGSSITGDVAVTQSLNTWYTFEFIKNGNSLTFNIYNTSTGTLVKTLTGTGSQTFSENANTVGMVVSYDSGKYFWFKNLKVESL